MQRARLPAPLHVDPERHRAATVEGRANRAGLGCGDFHRPQSFTVKARDSVDALQRRLADRVFNGGVFGIEREDAVDVAGIHQLHVTRHCRLDMLCADHSDHLE
ncbi:hypothetical protein D9M69_426030 [compost metagenome]